MKTIFDKLRDNEAYKAFYDRDEVLGNLSLSEEALFIAAEFKIKKETIFIVKNNAYAAQQLYERLITFCDKKGDALLYLAEDSLRVEAIAYSPENVANQIEVLDRLLSNIPSICILNTAALLRYHSQPDIFNSNCIDLSINQELNYELLKAKLFEAGYSVERNVDQPLCYASRGGIIDVFSCNYENPIRIEFFDNTIESIRFFDSTTRKTINSINEVRILPASNILLSNDQLNKIVENSQVELSKQRNRLADTQQQQLDERVNADIDALINYHNDNSLYLYLGFLEDNASIFDYKPNASIIISSVEEVKRSINFIQGESIAYIQEKFEEGRGLLRFQLYHDAFQLVEKKHAYLIHEFLTVKGSIQSNITTSLIGDFNFDATIKELIDNSKENIVVVAVNEKQSDYIQKILKEINIAYLNNTNSSNWKKGIQFYNKELCEGLIMQNEGIYIYSANELFPEAKRVFRYQNKYKNAQILSDFDELQVGDYVVHNQYGIGKYIGIVTKLINGIHKDFLSIAYKGDDELFVPLEQFKYVRKFVSKEGVAPKLSKLGSGEWEKTKSKVSEKIAELADRLIKLYSNRNQNIGFAFSKDNKLQKQFDSAFAYPLTIDQEKAVSDVKKDMESQSTMDRLLCGDVGFGKTEVACQAAFKAILDHKQVAFLCPTTILSLQHFETFVKRFSEYPVEIRVLNRFVSKSEQKKILTQVKSGNVDILIGTHRILSKDINFKDLGFLVIDEEQRFGVEHKEVIKEFKNSVDVLSLSATPIPRTLQMSLIGVRSLSQLNTPPKNRMPIQTYVIEKNATIVKDVIEREIARSGQVFYLFNNTKEIYSLSRSLQSALPNINIGIAHGRMHREEIEDVMMQFRNNTYQVLLCTTIIETGIDIPNANTIIVEQADHFGLSQLYQIKGRVGRSNRIAYAYLMYAPNKQLSEIASKRLKAIKEFAQLGSGYKIAMRDLTIRGAGDMLGPQQAGFIDSVGIDLYIEMLNEAIKEHQGIKKTKKPELNKTNIELDGYIPKEFESHDYAKIELYQRMDNVQNFKQLKEMSKEIQDNYGKLPKAIKLLFEKKRLDILSSQKNIDACQEVKSNIQIVFTSEWSNKIDGVKLFEEITKIAPSAKLAFKHEKIHLTMVKQAQWLNELLSILEFSQSSGLIKNNN